MHYKSTWIDIEETSLPIAENTSVQCWANVSIEVFYTDNLDWHVNRVLVMDCTKTIKGEAVSAQQTFGGKEHRWFLQEMARIIERDHLDWFMEELLEASRPPDREYEWDG